MEATLLSHGEETAGKLATRAGELQTLLGQFAPKTLAQVQSEFEAALSSAAPGAVNEAVAKLSQLVRDQAAQTMEDLKALDMWLAIKTPEVSDGNNFGVDVQNFVSESIKKLLEKCEGMLDTVSSYHQSRAQSLEKVVQDTKVKKETTKTADKETTDKDGDKKSAKESTMEKTEISQPTPLPDVLKHLAALDTKEYHACYLRLTDLRNAYVKANLLMSKNKKRLADPRGDGDGSRSNAMSMF